MEELASKGLVEKVLQRHPPHTEEEQEDLDRRRRKLERANAGRMVNGLRPMKVEPSGLVKKWLWRARYDVPESEELWKREETRVAKELMKLEARGEK